MIQRLVNKIMMIYYTSSSNRYIDFLKKKGIKIGKGVTIPNPKNVSIDYSRPTLLEIGDNVRLNQGLTIMTHDFASMVFVNAFNDFIPSHGKIKIGNNVYFGRNCTVLKGVEIGNNCIIGYGAVVMKNIPDNSVAVGSPAKVVCTLEEYYEKRKKTYFSKECIDYAISILESKNNINEEDFYDDYPTFVDGNNYKDYNYPYSRIFSNEQFEHWKKIHKAKYAGFNEFIAEVKKQYGKS